MLRLKGKLFLWLCSCERVLLLSLLLKLLLVFCNKREKENVQLVERHANAMA